VAAVAVIVGDWPERSVTNGSNLDAINHALILPKRATDERSEDFLKFLR
jgi:hypothetical protein